VLDEKGNLYLGANDGPNGHGVSVDPNGKRRWMQYAAIPDDDSPAVAAGGDVYFSLTWRHLYAFALLDGGVRWQLDTEMNLTASPVIADDGTIYACDGHSLYAIVPPGHPSAPAKSSWPMFRANARHTGRVNAIRE
jgi:outer membrane protein assembly factor BamB